MPGRLSGFPFVFLQEVRFRDLDMLGHVNNAVYATYFESARIAYYCDLTGQRLEELNIILAEMTISFRAPAQFGDELGIGVRIGRIGTKSFTMEYVAVRLNDDVLIADGSSVQVAFDYRSNASIPLTEEFRRLVQDRQEIKKA